MEQNTQSEQGELCFETQCVTEIAHEQGINTPVGNNNPAQPEVTTISEEGEAPRYVITADQIMMQEYVEDRFLIQDLVQEGKLCSIVGSSDTGKSLFLKQLAVAIVQRDEQFLGFDLNVRFGSAIYVTTEDDARSFQSYLRKRQITGDVNQFKNLRIIEDIQKLEVKLREELLRKPADAIIVDVFTDAYNGNMNDATSVRAFLNKYQQLINEFGVTVFFVHHTGKRTETNEPSKNNVLGSQGFESKMRFVGELRRDQSDPSVRHFVVLKANYLPDDKKMKSYVLKLSEDLAFYPTGERVSKEMLGAGMTRQSLRHNPDIVKMVQELKEGGLSTRKISDELSVRGVKMGKSAVSEMLKELN